MNNDLSYGLNPRNNAQPTRKKKPLSGFDDSSSEDDQKAPTTGRNATNKAISAEQYALRKRAAAALDEYDYDGQYESFSKNNKPKEKKNEDKSSKYISNLLQSAKRRTQEQEIIYERKIAKDQAAEDEEMQYEGKEKFVTSAYKRKLAEREEWVKEEKERERKEAEEDVTKKTSGAFLFAGFGRNVLSGDSDSQQGKDENGGKFDYERGQRDDKLNSGDYQHGDSSRETERWGRGRETRDTYQSRSTNAVNFYNRSDNIAAVNGGAKNYEAEVVPPKSRKQILEERAVKIRDARERYFQRKGLKPNQ